MSTPRALAVALVLLWIAPFARAATIVVEVEALPHKDAKRGVKDPYTGKPEGDAYGLERVDYKKLDEIVVYAVPEAAPGSDTPAPAPRAAEVPGQAVKFGERPPLLVASVGGVLRITNSTDAVQTYSCVVEGNQFEFVSVPPGESREFTLKATGLIEILMDSADDPAARVFVAPTPWVGLTKTGEDVKFEGLPAGKCKVVSWHPRLPGVEREVTLSDKKRTKTEVSVGVRDAGLPKVE